MPVPHPNVSQTSSTVPHKSRPIVNSPVYVFDLDDVLMPTSALFSNPHVKKILQSLNRNRNRAQSQHVHAAYQQFIHVNPMLVHRIRSLKGNRYLLTNGSRSHAVASTHALGIFPYLTNIVDANSGVGLKPDSLPYIRIEQLIRQTYASHIPTNQPALLPPIVFFDDRLENHIYPKRRGWTTVWIHPENTHLKPDYVDYTFPHIHAALVYFLMIQDQYNYN